MIYRRTMFAFVVPALAVAAGFAATAYSDQEAISMNTTESARIEEPPLACNPGALTAEERAKWKELGTRFIKEAKARRDLPNGFAFDLDRTPETLGDLGQFVEFESRCCPFVDFTVRVSADGKGVVLEMTVRKGVKELLADELGLDQ